MYCASPLTASLTLSLFPVCSLPRIYILGSQLRVFLVVLPVVFIPN